jgi:hypothetical protein
VTHQRRALNYAIKILAQKYSMLSQLGPATDAPEEVERECDALEFAAQRHSRPFFPVSPFL